MCFKGNKVFRFSSLRFQLYFLFCFPFFSPLKISLSSLKYNYSKTISNRFFIMALFLYYIVFSQSPCKVYQYIKPRHQTTQCLLISIVITFARASIICICFCFSLPTICNKTTFNLVRNCYSRLSSMLWNRRSFPNFQEN